MNWETCFWVGIIGEFLWIQTMKSRFITNIFSYLIDFQFYRNYYEWKCSSERGLHNSGVLNWIFDINRKNSTNSKHLIYAGRDYFKSLLPQCMFRAYWETDSHCAKFFQCSSSVFISLRWSDQKMFEFLRCFRHPTALYSTNVWLYICAFLLKNCVIFEEII